jgi:hypothetical protein
MPNSNSAHRKSGRTFGAAPRGCFAAADLLIFLGFHPKPQARFASHYFRSPAVASMIQFLASGISRRCDRVAGSAALAFVAVVLCALPATAQTRGFQVERFYPSAPGGAWMVMDNLDMHGGLGGALTLSGGYAHNPLQLPLPDGNHLALVRHQAFFDFGFAITYDRSRLYINLASPLAIQGDSGTVGAYRLTAPSASLGQNPDTISDLRLGFDTRLLGSERDHFRLGVGLQLFVPSGKRSDYLTDGTYRAMGRLLFAGSSKAFTYAAHLGIHGRPLEDAVTPGSPLGPEMLFGVAAGPRFCVGDQGNTAVVVGPEFFGETAFRSFFGSTTTGLEALMTWRLESTLDDGAQLRFKLGMGGGLNPHFGAPEWRTVVAVEFANQNASARP